MHTKPKNNPIGHLMLILLPILRIQPPHLPLPQHNLPIILNNLLPHLPTQIPLRLINQIHITPNLFRYRIVLIGKSNQTESW